MSSRRKRKYGYGIFSAALRSRPVKSDLSRSSITLVIGFAPRKVVLAEHFFAHAKNQRQLRRPDTASRVLGATWRYLSLLGARSALVVTRATLFGVYATPVGARATLPVTSCHSCQKVSRLWLKAPGCDSPATTSVSLGLATGGQGGVLLNKTASAARELFVVRCSAPDRCAQRLRLIRTHGVRSLLDKRSLRLTIYAWGSFGISSGRA